nr:DUF1343 domain-containing protein [Alteromonas aestuariivivens]
MTTAAEQSQLYLPKLQNKQVALVVNQTSMVGNTHLADYLLENGIKVSRVLAPEHGFRGQSGAGEHIADGRDDKTGLPILSIYGKTRKPTPEMLEGIDTLVFDIQDVGARFYTYISSLHYVMEAAAEQGVAVMVLDRPNPNGRFVDGPVLQRSFQSFVGMHPIPVLHGMTVGELARMIKGEGWINQAGKLGLTVIPVSDYNKSQSYPLPVAPSPNLPNATAVRLYPSLCFFEATTVSVGRGTDWPFQVIGHDRVPLGTFEFTPQSRPQSAPQPKLQGKTLMGQDLRFAHIEGLDLTLFMETYQRFAQRGETFFSSPDFMDKLSGTDELRKAIEAGKSAEEIRASWQPALNEFKRLRQPYLLYPGS